MTKTFSVIIPARLKSSPSRREISAARLVANFFQKNVEIIDRGIGKTADYLIDRQFWELKTIKSAGKRTVQHALHRAARQATNVIIDARGTKMNILSVRSQIKHHLKYIPRIKRLLLIEKDGMLVKHTYGNFLITK